MTNKILLLHGAGEGAYRADLLLTQSLNRTLGQGYDVQYPQLVDEANAPYELWKEQIEQLLHDEQPRFLVGHSVGGSHLIKMLCETRIDIVAGGIFLLAAPFWGGDGWQYEGYKQLELAPDAADRLPAGAKLFLYHARDDETVPYAHMSLYAKRFPGATLRELASGGHQFGNDLNIVANDIRGI